MASQAAVEKRGMDLSVTRRWVLIVLISMGSSIIYAPAYMKAVFYDAQIAALDISNAQMGELTSAFGWTACATYLFSGLLADRVRMRVLSTAGFILTALLTFWYALLPSYNLLLLIFVGMGVSTILIWWGCRYKLVRLVSSEKDYGRNIGVSYAFYGVAGLLIGFGGTWLFNAFGPEDKGAAFQMMLWIVGGVLVVMGIVSWVFIPKFEGELTPDTSAAAILKDTVKSLANPVVVLSALTVFFVYFFYTSTYYTAPYMTLLGADQTTIDLVSTVRTYGVTLIAAPVFGMLVARWKKASLVTWIGSALAAAGFAIAALVTGPNGSVAAIIVLAIGLGFICNGTFAVTSGMLTEGRVPLAIFGAAAGVLSVVGFAPDTFSGIWLGGIIDKATAAGDPTSAYVQIWWILAAFAIAAVLSALALAAYVRANKAKLDAAYEAAEIEAAKAAGDSEALTDLGVAEEPAVDATDSTAQSV